MLILFEFLKITDISAHHAAIFCAVGWNMCHLTDKHFRKYNCNEERAVQMSSSAICLKIFKIQI